jgi:hypothetical protein
VVAAIEIGSISGSLFLIVEILQRPPTAVAAVETDSEKYVTVGLTLLAIGMHHSPSLGSIACLHSSHQYSLPNTDARPMSRWLSLPQQSQRPTAQALRKSISGELGSEVERALGARPEPVRLDTGYIDYQKLWQKPKGSGAVTRALRKYLMSKDAPNIIRRLDASPQLRSAVLARMDRDARIAGENRAADPPRRITRSRNFRQQRLYRLVHGFEAGRGFAGCGFCSAGAVAAGKEPGRVKATMGPPPKQR